MTSTLEMKPVLHLYIYCYLWLLTVPTQSNPKVCIQSHLFGVHTLQAHNYINNRWSYNKFILPDIQILFLLIIKSYSSSVRPSQHCLRYCIKWCII